TLRDGDALLARIQTALARQGDEEAGRWLAEHAQPGADSERTRARGCPDEGDDDDLRIAALNGLLQMDAANAVPILKRVLARRDACSAGMRRKAVFLLSHTRTAPAPPKRRASRRSSGSASARRPRTRRSCAPCTRSSRSPTSRRR